MWRDIRYAIRGLRRSPAFTIVAVVSLALGIGANTAIFSLINALILRALPVHEPGRLVEFLVHYPGDPAMNFFSRESYAHFRDNNHVFAAITALNHLRFTVRGDSLAPETVDGGTVLGNFFPLLGLKPAAGRWIEPLDDRIGDPNSAVAVISWSFWQSRFNRDPAILGKKIVIEEVPMTIIGVTPRDFFGVRAGARADLWIPAAVDAIIHNTSHPGTPHLIARLKPGVSIGRARAEMAVLFQWTFEERNRSAKDPLYRQLTFSLEPAGNGLATGLRDRFAKPLQAVMAVVAFLLLIACTNVASMLLARGAVRQREIAVRLSLGAGRWRLIRQVMTESLLLSATGGVLGVLVARITAGTLLRVIQSGRPIIDMPQLDVHAPLDSSVLLFTSMAALLTGLLFGLAPAWNVLASAPAGSLREAGRSSESKSRRLFGKGLIVAQVALAWDS